MTDIQAVLIRAPAQSMPLKWPWAAVHASTSTSSGPLNVHSHSGMLARRRLFMCRTARSSGSNSSMTANTNSVDSPSHAQAPPRARPVAVSNCRPKVR